MNNTQTLDRTYNELAFYGLKILKRTPEETEVLLTLDTAKLISNIIDSILIGDTKNFSRKRKYYVFNGVEMQKMTIAPVLDIMRQHPRIDYTGTKIDYSEIDLSVNSHTSELTIKGTIRALQEIKNALRALIERTNVFQNNDVTNACSIQCAPKKSEFTLKLAGSENIFKESR
jgi:hypothetical protein